MCLIAIGQRKSFSLPRRRTTISSGASTVSQLSSQKPPTELCRDLLGPRFRLSLTAFACSAASSVVKRDSLHDQVVSFLMQLLGHTSTLTMRLCATNVSDSTSGTEYGGVQKLETVSLAELNAYMMVANGEESAVFVAFDTAITKLTNARATEGYGEQDSAEYNLPYFLQDIVRKSYISSQAYRVNFSLLHELFTVARIFDPNQRNPGPSFALHGEGNNHGDNISGENCASCKYPVGDSFSKDTHLPEANDQTIGPASAVQEASNTYQRWGRVNAEVCKFVGCHESALKEQASGQTENDVMKLAHDIFFNDNNVKFCLEHCWRKLRFDQKWRSHCQPKEKRKESGPEVLSAEEEVRPPGVKASKAAKRKKPNEAAYEQIQSILAQKNTISNKKILDRLLAKNIETLSDHEVALTNKLISEML
ncbi:hypothetical protein DY000_02026058 [Brassica cretica]|uniref:No apical meristem-associated C-terminal domain-containing protein n=1 Tax=Brassica cretica TaxID=69181 RepID=A0ABQ7E4H0_BRACR|nr:hypothetical protein DY000_02026058 [Brassica cretica]